MWMWVISTVRNIYFAEEIMWWRVVSTENTSRGDLSQTSQRVKLEEPYAVYNS